PIYGRTASRHPTAVRGYGGYLLEGRAGKHASHFGLTRGHCRSRSVPAVGKGVAAPRLRHDPTCRWRNTRERPIMHLPGDWILRGRAIRCRLRVVPQPIYTPAPARSRTTGDPARPEYGGQKASWSLVGKTGGIDAREDRPRVDPTKKRDYPVRELVSA